MLLTIKEIIMDEKKERKTEKYDKEYNQWLISQSVSNPKVLFKDLWESISETLMIVGIAFYFVHGFQPTVLLYILTVVVLEFIYKMNVHKLINEFLFTKLYEQMLEDIRLDELKGIDEDVSKDGSKDSSIKDDD